MTNVKPPKWAQRFIEWYCKTEIAEDLIGDLNEYFERNVENIGPRRAKIIYLIDAIKFLRPYTVRKPKFINPLINWIMIGSYIKTSGRNVMRNKLFSAINIVGLAISMSVGLLLIGFAHDLLSYDKFNEKGSRIYRVTSQPVFDDGYGSKLASSSVKVGKLLQDKVTGVEETAILRTDFSGDAKIGSSVVPFTGIYAEPSMLKIFTLPMLKGNASTALQEPYSIVLTETSAKKLFGVEEAFGKAIKFDSLEYTVTGILKDVPFFSHIQFESLVSFSTVEKQRASERYFLTWGNIWQNYVYLLLPENANPEDIQRQLNIISEEENKGAGNEKVRVSLLPLYDIMLGEDLSNPIGPVMPSIVLWIIGGLTMIVVFSACFNYTNLSIARSMRRFKEVGLRKVIGAGKSQVRLQFLAEAIIISLAALLFSFGMFLMLRPQFMNIAPELAAIVRLEITAPMVLGFIAFSMVVGIVAGLLPATFFAKVSIIHALRDVSSVKVFRRLNLRRALVVVQYTFTLIFITTTLIGYQQYKSMLAFDLGFSTENILNISLQGNKAEALVNQLKVLPEVEAVSQSVMVTSVGSQWGGRMKYKDPADSAGIWYNIVDENYLALHDHKLIAGQNFIARPTTSDATSEIIINEQTLKRFNIGNGDASKAIGEEVIMDGKKLTVVGVMKDFHYNKVDSKIEPVVFIYLTPDETSGVVNVRLRTDDPVGTMAKIQEIWKDVDPVHPFQGRFYEDAIQAAYSEFSAMIKIIGFLSFLAISIASMGLFGMVVFTTETRLKEISIRKVLGASSGNLVLLLSRGFFILLSISALIALPLTYFFFENVVLTSFPYHNPVGMGELFGGLVAVMIIAFAMIGSQTMRAARSNPAEILKSE